MLQYMMSIPQREFLNPCATGLLHNLTEDIYATLGIHASEAQLYSNFPDNDEREKQLLNEEIGNSNEALQFPEFKEGPKYLVNWDRAYIYILPQMLNHPKRREIWAMMKLDEPRMI